MAQIDLLNTPGCPVERQRFTWKELNPKPLSKLDDDAFSRVRVILLNGMELDSLRLKHMMARCNGELRLPLAEAIAVQSGAKPALADDAVIVLVLGILGMTTEYRHQTITATFLVTPRRGLVLLGKVKAFAVTTMKPLAAPAKPTAAPKPTGAPAVAPAKKQP